jgi:hypothetical protein
MLVPSMRKSSAKVEDGDANFFVKKKSSRLTQAARLLLDTSRLRLLPPRDRDVAPRDK